MNTFSTILFRLSIFLLFFIGNGVLATQVFASQVTYEKLLNKTIALESKVRSYPAAKDPEKCEFTTENSVDFWVREKMMTTNNFLIEQIGFSRSRCYHDKIKLLDKRIFQIKKDFSKTENACNPSEFVQSFKELLDERKNYKQYVSVTEKNNLPEYCEDDPKKEIFTETTRAWKKLMTKFTQNEKTKNQMVSGSKNLKEKQKNILQKKAEQNAKAYWSDYQNQFDLNTALSEERSKISGSLKGLSSGNSSFVRTQYWVGENGSAEKTAQNKAQKEINNANYDQYTSNLLSKIISLKNHVENRERDFNRQFIQSKVFLEGQIHFNEPLTNDINTTFMRAGNSFESITPLLEQNQKALKGLHKRQNSHKQ